MAGTPEAVGSELPPGQDLDVRAKQGPGEIVVCGLGIAAPPRLQARPGPGPFLPLAILRLLGQDRGPVLDGEAENEDATVEEAVGVRVHTLGGRSPCVVRPAGACQLTP